MYVGLINKSTEFNISFLTNLSENEINFIYLQELSDLERVIVS